jgi:TRAP-type uncharacterized transport system fused permease subunit
MIASIILGMGLPTVAIYITLSAIVVPALIEMGVYPLAAHLFVFYFGVMGFVTPPVCVAAFAAAGIAEANPMKTGFYATKLGVAGFIVPFLFAYEPRLLFVGSYLNIFWGFLSGVIGIIALGGAIQGWMIGKAGIVTRVLLAAGALLLIKPGLITDIIGFSILFLALLMMFAKRRLSSPVAETANE